jgi:outer membrane protein assembly factor BamE (lipoprotein component of BamABCDE complex)
MRTFITAATTILLTLLTSGCLTQRTVSQGGHTVSQEYVIKRPLKEALDNSR